VNTVRQLVGADFPVAIKLNSADFQRGGFAFEDSLQVARWLQDAGVDLIEISGGTYEQPKLLGIEGLEAEEPQAVAETTLQREAYFVDFAKAMKAELKIPLMVTGGFRTKSAMEQAVRSGAADVIGLGRPMCTLTDAPKRLLGGMAILPKMETQLKLFPDWLASLRKVKMLRSIDAFAAQYWYYAQLYALGKTGRPNPDQTVFASLREVEATHKKWLRERRAR
jgi:2,4-dienoyl-CoA reductase-like NADH-dependent reductase (Old Yellow Enzyme family)